MGISDGALALDVPCLIMKGQELSEDLFIPHLILCMYDCIQVLIPGVWMVHATAMKVCYTLRVPHLCNEYA